MRRELNSFIIDSMIIFGNVANDRYKTIMITAYTQCAYGLKLLYQPLESINKTLIKETSFYIHLRDSYGRRHIH